MGKLGKKEEETRGLRIQWKVPAVQDKETICILYKYRKRVEWI